MAINFNGVKIKPASGGAGGGVSWPGDGTKLLAGDGSQVIVGDGLTLSAGTLEAPGSVGPQGPQGFQGTQGAQGLQGTQGAQGNQGFQGEAIQGPQGTQGPQGAAGSGAASGATYIATIGDSTVSLLLHMDGANNSTTFTDKSYSPKTVTAYGDAKISTAQSNFGEASATFDGTGDYLLLDNTTDLAFGSGNFTIEGWVRLNSVSYQMIFSKQSTTAFDIAFGINNSTSVILGLNGTPGGITRTVPTISVNTWYHFAVVGNSGNIRIYWNGTQAGANIAYVSVNNNVTKWIIGADQWNSPINFLNGYLDEFRITKGLARYASNFTPSASAFTNADGSAELPATPAVGNVVYSDTGIYVCSSSSPVIWKKFDGAPSQTITI